jgi:hypothetical protein
VKKPVIDVDDLEDSGDEAPSPSTDLTASTFAVRNTANVLVTESATVRATLVQFQDTLAGSLDRLTEFMVKEQAEARENRRAVWDLLQRLVRAAEGVSSRQMETVPATVGNAEAGPSEAVVELTDKTGSDPLVSAVR